MRKRVAQPGYAGLRTFCGAEVLDVDQIVESDVVVIGVPFDTTLGSRPGARFGPAGIREKSMHLRYLIDAAAGETLVNVDTGKRIRHEFRARLLDAGDVNVFPSDVRRTASSVADKLSIIARAGAFPVVLGGDHYITFPSLKGYVRGLCDRKNLSPAKAKVGYIHLDAHFDLADDSTIFGPHFHGATARLIAGLESVDLHNMVWIGVRGHTREERWRFAIKDGGGTAYTTRQLREQGIADVLKQAIERASDGVHAVYLSIDIDVVDSTEAPGTGEISFGGLTATELLEAVGLLREHEIISAIDMMEVAPNLDSSGITERLAAEAILEFIKPRLFSFHNES